MSMQGICSFSDLPMSSSRHLVGHGLGEEVGRLMRLVIVTGMRSLSKDWLFPDIMDISCTVSLRELFLDGELSQLDRV